MLEDLADLELDTRPHGPVTPHDGFSIAVTRAELLGQAEEVLLARMALEHVPDIGLDQADVFGEAVLEGFEEVR